LRQGKPKALGRYASFIGILFGGASEEGQRCGRVSAIEQLLGSSAIRGDE
jgi:hypothetical protein